MSATVLPIQIHKFGGTSVASVDRIRHVAGLIADAASEARLITVVSALGGVTDELERALELAVQRSGDYKAIIEAIRIRHRDVATGMAGDEALISLDSELDSVWSELSELLEGVSLLRECTPRIRDAVMGLGERASAPILAAALTAAGTRATTVDSKNLIRTDDTFGEANVNEGETKRLCGGLVELAADAVVVVPGFTGATADGIATTLGRSGSDYTATILAAAIGAERVVIWTDVDGVLSADPRLVPAAFTLEKLSYREAAEMAWFGAKVLHPRTMRPIRDASIPLVIRNTMNPDASGTIISDVSSDTDEHVKAVTSVPDLSLAMIEGTGMMGIPGVAARAFHALAERDVNVLLISQASSEQSICIGIRSIHASKAEEALKDAFDRELDRGDVSRIYTIPDCAVVSLVGDQMRMKPGIAGRMFSTLGLANINVLAIAQGAAETNISAVVAGRDTERAVRALHESFARAFERLHLFLLGPGAVGSRLLDLLDQNTLALGRDHHINLRLVGLANSRKMIFDAEGIAFTEASSRLDKDGRESTLERISETLLASHLERLVFIDASASGEVAELYPELLHGGIGVITPNKRANTRELAFYDRLRKAATERNVPFLYETTVGAALPVIQTVHNLVRSGDRIRRLQGILSGTLAFVFNSMGSGMTFSEAVLEAHRRGFTEPDPRDDLSGEDVARKLLTLAREGGLRIERADIVVESLVSADSAGLSVEEFMDRLPSLDKEWGERTRDARVQYVATLDESGCRVALETLEPGSPFNSLRGTDNMVVIESDRYFERPLVIQGAGAGPELTASGILSDVLIAAERML